MKKRWLPLVVILVAAMSLAGTSLAAKKDPAALIIAQGGLGDESWNDTAYAGFKAALKTSALEGRPIESKDVVAMGEEIMRRAAEGGFGLVISLEYVHGQPMEALAKDYPKVGFVILNQVRKGPNLASILFQEHEGSYLAGALAALCTTDTSIKGINPEPVIGVIGGMKSVGIDKFIVGYIQGAKAVNPKVQVKVAYAGSFGDPAKGQQVAEAMFEQGADVVYQVAGGTGIGVIQAAKAAGHYAIGVDTDQDGMAPGHVLTSMIKRVDVAIENVTNLYGQGKFPGGRTLSFGLADNGVGLSPMKHTKDRIPAAHLEKVEQLKQDIMAGKIQVWNTIEKGYPDFFK